MAAYNIGKYVLLAIVTGLIAAVTAFRAGFAGTATSAILVTAIVAGIVAFIAQYKKTGSMPGPTVTYGTIATIILTAVFAFFPALLGATTPYAFSTAAIGILLLIEEEIDGMPVSTMAELLAKDVASAVPPSNSALDTVPVPPKPPI